MKANQYKYSQEPFFPNGKSGGKYHEDELADKVETGLPKGWKIVSLGSITKIYDGTHYTPKYTEKGIPFYSVEQVTSDNFSKTKFVSEADYTKACKRAKIEKGDILMTRIGDIGTAKHIDWEPKADFYVSLVLIKSNEAFDSRYMSYYINGASFKRELWFRTIHVAFPVKINLGEIGNCRVCLPPLHEQKAIADMLSIWDEAIEKTGRLIVAKQKQFKWLLRTLITDQCDKKSGWKKAKLGDLCQIKKGEQLNGTNMKEDGVYYALNGGIGPSGRTDGWNTEAETITISEGGNSCGYVNFNTERFWSGGHCYSLLKPQSHIIDNGYLFFFLKHNERKIMSLRVGSGLPNIQKKDLTKFEVTFPPLEKQRNITVFAQTAQEEVNLLQCLIQRFKTQKRGLMQKLLTGQWRVKSTFSKQKGEKP